MTSSPTRPARAGRLRLLLTGVVAVLALTACGGADPAPGPLVGSGAPVGAPAAAFPVTVEHAYGSTTITAEPKRVIALGYSDPDALLALGIAPIGIVDWFKVPPTDNKWFWEEAGYAGAVPEVVGVREEYNLEKIAALKPDLIVAEYSGMSRDQYDLLSKITKVVAQPKDYEQYAAPWQVMTTQIAKAVGREEQGRQLVAGVEQKIAATKAAHPEWAGQTALAATYDSGYVAYTTGDAKTDLLEQLGFTVPAQLDTMAAGASETPVSNELVGLLDVDKLVWVVSSDSAVAEIKARPEYANLAVARQNRAMFLVTAERQKAIAAAFSYNSVLSLPYVVDQLVPELVALPPKS